MSPWETLPHPTDLRVRVRGRDRRELFAEAVRSTFALMAAPRRGWPATLSGFETRELRVTGDDAPTLLRRLLSECVFQFESDGFLARDVALEELSERACRVRLEGACFAADDLDVRHVIKAVTWHGLAIQDEPGGVSAEVLHDL